MTRSLAHPTERKGAYSDSSRPRLSAVAYFSWVALATVLGFAVAALLRPNFAYKLRETVGLAKPLIPAPQSFYAVRVAPLLQSHCAGCHGERRQKGKLRLDSFASAMRGGK